MYRLGLFTVSGRSFYLVYVERTAWVEASIVQEAEEKATEGRDKNTLSRIEYLHKNMRQTS